MNILFIGTTDNRGGAGRLSMSLAEGLAARGHTVRQIVGYKYSKHKNVYELSHTLSAKSTLIMRHLRSFVISNDIAFGQDEEIIQHPWFKEADVISLHNKHGNFISLNGIVEIARIKPIVWTLHDMWPITTHCAYTIHANNKIHNPYDCNQMAYPPLLWGNGNYLYDEKIKKLSSAPITYITPSQWLKSKVLQTPLRNKSIQCIPNGIDTTIFVPKTKQVAKENCLLNYRQRYALFIAEGGEKNYRKGMDKVQKLAQSKLAKKMGIQFLIIGGLQSKSVGNITYIPRIENQHQLADYYSSADVFLFPSQADNCPLTVLESLAVGTKVLAFKTCGVSELFTHKKAGYLARLGSDKDFEAGFDYLMNHQSRKVYSLIESKNNKDIMIKTYEKAMKQLVKSK